MGKPANDNTRSTSRVLLLFSVFLLAMNLRAPFTSAAPLLEILKAQFQLNAAEAGLLITLPLLAFAFISPIAAILPARIGLERSLLLSLVIVGIGICIRSLGPVSTLYLGTAVIGAGIAIGNVLLPSVLKRDFPDWVAPLTACYVLVMGCTAALISTVAVPLAVMDGSSWRVALLSALILPILAIVAWLPRMRMESIAVKANVTATAKPPIWRSALAWQVTVFLGLDCFLYYVGVSWLPAILEDAHFTQEQAGSMHGVLLLSTALPGLLLIPLAPRMKDQRHAACLLSLSIMVGLLGLLLLPAYAVIWILFFGFGAGGGLILALSFLSLRTVDSVDAASLSGLSQAFGYLLAASGPAMVGFLHDISGGWGPPLVLCAILSVVMAAVGLMAGRNRQISVDRLAATV
ncbi:MFS transporter [Rhizobium beringeri]